MVRSCYSSQWRLWSNRPDLLTRGFFYFVPDDTPFLPYFHNFYSADWTWEHHEPNIEPLLGEIKRPNRPYEKGLLPIDRPPPVALGGEDCYSHGEMFPQVTVPGRDIVGGIDTTVWTSKGESVPMFPDPANLTFWYQPSGLPVVPVGTPVANWPDSGPYAIDLSQTNPANQPLYVATGLAGLGSLFFDNSFPGIKALLFTPGFIPCKSYMVYVVAVAGGNPFAVTGPGIFPVNSVYQGVMESGGNVLRYQYDSTSIQGPTSSMLGASMIVSVRRKTGYVETAYNGKPAASASTSGPQTDGFGGIGAGIWPAAGIRSVTISEVILVNGIYSDAQNILYLQYLSKKYQIPLEGP